MGDNRNRILIVDDIPENIDVLGGILSDYKRIFALNGKSALKKAMSDKPPDLILLDIMMPEMDGYEVCKRLKSEQKTRDIPVIFISAKGEIEDETKGFEAGAVDYITKPVIPSIVMARVKTHLELKNAREQLKIKNNELIEAARLREDVERLTRHDLKNPLNSVIGYPKLIMEQENLSEKSKSFLNEIEKSGLRMLRMINHSLDIFKMERGMYQLNRMPVDILKTVRLVDSELYEIKGEKNLKINIILNGKTPHDHDNFYIMGEELLLYSMLGNLIKNALEASPRRETVTIMMNKIEHFVIQINNKGLVPKEIYNSFFDKYVTKGKNSGTGLGTYSAKLTAEVHKGSIQMHSSEQTGTTITINFPDTAAESCINFNNLNIEKGYKDKKSSISYQPKKITTEQLSEIISKINKMLNLLEIGDTQAEEYLEILKQFVHDSDTEDKIRILEEHIENYDFDAAHEMLQDILNTVIIRSAELKVQQ